MVFKRLGHALMVFALLGAIGGHWVVFQSVAWTTMLAANLRTGSLSEAVGRTFDGNHPCALCQKIATGKQTEKKSDVAPELMKFEYSFTPGTFTFTPPSQSYEVCLLAVIYDGLSHAPPVPPPKRFLG